MANLLLVLTFAITLLYGYRLMDKLDRFLNSVEIDGEDTVSSENGDRDAPPQECPASTRRTSLRQSGISGRSDKPRS